MAFQGVMRTTGAALGNTLIGLLLHLCYVLYGEPPAEANNGQGTDFRNVRYPVSSYIFVHLLCVFSGLFALWTCWNVTAENKTVTWEESKDGKEPSPSKALHGEPLLEPEPEHA
jgi:hypothetical protein